MKYTPLGFGFADIADKQVTLQAVTPYSVLLDRLVLHGPGYATALRVAGADVLALVQRRHPIVVAPKVPLELDVFPVNPQPPLTPWLRALWRTRLGARVLPFLPVREPRTVGAAIICMVELQP